jgi:hypothetical protein
VSRMVPGQDDPLKTVVEDAAEFELDFEVKGQPEVIPDRTGHKFAQMFQFDIEHRRGVMLPIQLMREGDLLLDPLYLLGPGKHEEKTEYLPNGHVLTKEDLLYLKSKSFRQVYDAGGAQLLPSSFKVGQTLAAYSLGYDQDNALTFEESGFQNSQGEILISNGTVLNAKHVAMLNYYTPIPARIRQNVELDLESYLRVDWPDSAKPKNRQFWVNRTGSEQPLLLFSYQIKEGDKPLADIRTPEDRQVICQAGVPLEKMGPRNSIEILDLKKDAIMYSKQGRTITSVDPITGDLSDKEVEPGQLILSPRNEGQYLRSFMVRNQDDLNSMLLDDKYSFARGIGSETAEFPFNAFLTHYTIPFLHDCVYGCDAQVEILDAVLVGKKHCNVCSRDLQFRPYVYNEIDAYPFAETLWKQRDIQCVYCDYTYNYRSAHALAGQEVGMVEYPSVSLNVVSAERLREIRLTPGTTLAKDVKYYQNGIEIVVPEGTEINDELRQRLIVRATSPIYISEPKGVEYEAAQCPRCFGWNVEPNHVQRLKGSFAVDEVRRGLACFPTIEGRVNRLDIVVFGLSSQREPISGKGLAKVVTFRRYGDEHFRQIQGWEKTSEHWEYLPRYQSEAGYRLPLPLKAGESKGKSSLFNLDGF